jgi:hypothetical protein
MDDERYEYRAFVIRTRDHLSARKAILQAHSDLAKEFGPGWEFEGSVPGAVASAESPPESHSTSNNHGTVLLFRRRKQQRVTGVSIGP